MICPANESPYPSNSSCRGLKIKKIMYDLAENDDFDREMIATYEEVAKLYPRPGVYRPVILIGSPGMFQTDDKIWNVILYLQYILGVGRNTLIKKLIASDPEKYRCPVPCKSKKYFAKEYLK